MLLTHLDNLKLLPKPEPPLHNGPFGRSPLDGLEVQALVYLPAFRKTGRLIWPDDPFVTYEESDRSWGVALGIATEEVEPVFYDFTPPKRSCEDIAFIEFREEMDRRLVESFRIPQRILFGGFA